MAKTKKYDLKKHTGFLGNELLFTIFEGATETEAKILFYLTKFDRKIQILKNPDSKLTTFKINVKELAKYCNIEPGSIYNNVDNLGKLKVRSMKDGGKYKSFKVVIPGATLFNGELELDMYNEIFEELNRTIGKFTPIYNLDKLMSLKHFNSIKMFILLNYTDNINEPYKKQHSFKSIKELNDFFGVNYEKIKHIKDKIINQIEKDLEGLIKFDYRPIFDENAKGRGRKPVIGYTFSQRDINVFTSKDLKDDEEILDEMSNNNYFEAPEDSVLNPKNFNKN